MSDDEYKQALDFMKQSLVEGKGKVGSFIYHSANNSLVIKDDKLPNEQDTCYGRVFFNPESNKFTVCVGSWISENPDAIDVIVEEFALENEDYDFAIREHWELGMGYGE